MLYAVIAVIACLLIFVLVSFLMSIKKYNFNIDGKDIRIENKTAHLKIFVDNVLVNDYYMAQLIKGEEFKLDINGKEALICCRSSSFGYKLSIQIYIDGEMVADNGVKLKKKKEKKEKIKLSEINISSIYKDKAEDDKEIENKIKFE